MPHASLKPAVKLISLDSTSNVFCASNSRSSFFRPTASMSRRSSSRTYSIWVSSSGFNDVVGYLPLGNYCVVKQSTRKYNGYDWVIFRYQGTEYWTAVIGDRNRVEDCNCDCN